MVNPKKKPAAKCKPIAHDKPAVLRQRTLKNSLLRPASHSGARKAGIKRPKSHSGRPSPEARLLANMRKEIQFRNIVTAHVEKTLRPVIMAECEQRLRETIQAEVEVSWRARVEQSAAGCKCGPLLDFYKKRLAELSDLADWKRSAASSHVPLNASCVRRFNMFVKSSE